MKLPEPVIVTDSEGLTLIDLKETFSEYRVEAEADGETWFSWPPEDRPWLWELRCRHGRVYPWGGTLLTVLVEDDVPIARQAFVLPQVRDRRGHWEEVRGRVEYANLLPVLRLLRPQVRPGLTQKLQWQALSPEEQERRAEELRQHLSRIRKVD